jgi:hypothetical protein
MRADQLNSGTYEPARSRTLIGCLSLLLFPIRRGGLPWRLNGDASSFPLGEAIRAAPIAENVYRWFKTTCIYLGKFQSSRYTVIPTVTWFRPASICSGYIDDQRQTRDRTWPHLLTVRANIAINIYPEDYCTANFYLCAQCFLYTYTSNHTDLHSSEQGSLLICSISSQTKYEIALVPLDLVALVSFCRHAKSLCARG